MCPIFRRNLKENEESQFISLLNFPNGVNIQDRGEDVRVWEASKNGSFSVSSFFKTILINSRERSALSSIWKLKAPLRSSFRVVGTQEKDTYYGFLKEELDDYNEWLPYVLEVRGICGPSHVELQNNSVYLDFNGRMV